MEPAADTMILGALWWVVFLFSTTLHEAAHAWSALKLGDPTAYEGGQVTLNPVPHVQRAPFGMVLVPWLSFAFAGWMIGWASAPYDPEWADRHPRRAAWMSLAGPASNLLLVLLSGVAIRVGVGMGVFDAPMQITFSEMTTAVDPAWGGLATMLSITFTLNLLLFAFNLIPVPPLDGSGAVPLFLSENAARKYHELLFGQPMLSLFGIVIAWRLFEHVFPPLWGWSVDVLYPGMYF